jgi:hypothetical protein
MFELPVFIYNITYSTLNYIKLILYSIAFWIRFGNNIDFYKETLTNTQYEKIKHKEKKDRDLINKKYYYYQHYRDNLHLIHGYNDESLFFTLLSILKNNDTDKDKDNKKCLKVLTTPINHQNYNMLLEKMIGIENIYIMEMDKNYTKIKDFDTSQSYDMIFINHLFGIDTNIDKIEEYLNSLEPTKHSKKPLIVENRSFGGTKYIYERSSPCVDISIYNTNNLSIPNHMGGGGYMCYFSDNIDTLSSWNLLNGMLLKIENYPRERESTRLLNLIYNLFHIILYRSRFLLYYTGYYFNLLNLFTNDIGLWSFTENNIEIVNDNNKIFNSIDYMLKPSLSQIYYMKKTFDDLSIIELNIQKFKNKYFNFTNQLREYYANELMPWYMNISFNTNNIDCSINSIYYFMITTINSKFYNNINITFNENVVNENVVNNNQNSTKDIELLFKRNNKLFFTRNHIFRPFENKSYTGLDNDKFFADNLYFIPHIMNFKDKDNNKLSIILQNFFN